MEENHNVLVYPHWSNASNLIDTDESLGTIALHNEALENAINQIEINANDLHLSSELKFLMKTMGTALPVLPVSLQN